MDEKAFLIEIVALVVIVVTLTKYISKQSSDADTKRSKLVDTIEGLKKRIGEVEGKVIRLTQDNEELRRDNEALRVENVAWRKAARKWYLIAVSINSQFKEQAEEGLDDPSDL